MSRAPRLFTIAPGAPFLARFVAALLAGHIIPGFPGSDDPAELAAATIFVPTRRSAAALAHEFARALRRSIVLLPTIVPLGGLEDIETSLAFHDGEFGDGFLADIPDAVGEAERRLVLASFIRQWAAALRGAIVSIDAGGVHEFIEDEPPLVATSAAQAWHLSGDLAGLIDDMIIEGVEWGALNSLAPEDYDDYWRITLDFLKIAVEAWPRHLETRGLVDAAARQSRLVDAEIARIAAASSQGPLIALGSTGANPATARLLGAIARHACGAVVLPGLDTFLDEGAWALVAGDAARGLDPADGHPQAMLHRLLRRLGVARADVIELGVTSLPMRARARFVSEAMRPAEATDAWFEIARARGDGLTQALADVTLIDAADEREEALCLAIEARRALERDDATIAIVTPDRALARRVAGELARWNIEVDDSAGETLALSPGGVLARLVLSAASRDSGAIEMLALLSHADARLGYQAAELAQLRDLVEIGVLRAVSAAGLGNAELIAKAREAAGERDAHPAAHAIDDDEWRDMGALLDRLDAALAPLRALPRQAVLVDWIAAHREALAQVTAPAAGGDDAEALDDMFASLAAPALPGFDLDAADYAALIEAVSAETIVWAPKHAHPRLKILGPLEARLLHADVMLLGGLDESIWPPPARNDPFLNRPMRAALGLGPPERRIGQTAHDFTQLLGAPRVVVSRARKRGGSPTNPSRFLQRMAALAGTADWERCRARGAQTIALARALDHAAHAPRPRPAPKPPVDLRPKQLSVTRIETLRRDPYSIYAEFILRLQPLPPLGVEPDARETGIFLHAVMTDFARAYPAAHIPDDSLARLDALAREKFAARFDDPAFRLFFWPRIEKGLAGFVEWETRRRDGLTRIYVEQSGKLPIMLDGGSIFKLTAQADRIERRRDDSLIVIDFKTGAPPSLKVVACGFAPQLTLEAAMIEAGGFEIELGDVLDAEYVRLLGDVKSRALSKAGKGKTFQELAAEHFEGLRVLLNQLRLLETPYLPRPFPQFIHAYSAYDHLARVKEWSSGAEGEA